MKQEKKILLTFDVEEFDFVNGKDKFEISKKGLQEIEILLDKYNIKVTFFTTLKFAEKYPKFIKELEKKGHEIASHGYIHSDSYLESMEKLEKVIKKVKKLGLDVKGFRAPRYEIKGISDLEKFGFKYDSSLHPTCIPGRYFNIFKSRKIHKKGNILEIPPSVLPLIRLPIFWLAFKNFGKTYAKIFTRINFLFSDYTMLVFHPWEFSDLRKIKMMKIMKTKSGKELLKMLENYIVFCKNRGYEFSTINDYLEKSVK